MEDQDSNNVYNNVVDKLLETFGEILSRDLMFAIVESYNGDLDRSANAIINITMDGSCVTPSSTENELNSTNTTSNIDMAENCMSPKNTQNDMKSDHIFTFSTNNQDVNQPGNSQQQMGQLHSENEISPPASNSPPVQQPVMSYANVYQTPILPIKPALKPISKSEAIKPKPSLKIYRNIEFISSATNHKLKTIYKNHEHGWRTLIILRGAPGCGKTFLAQSIVDAMYNKSNNNYKMHIFSTDQYFMRGSVYEYCKFKLSEAHQWNQRCVLNAMKQGVSPVIVDNTNTEIWEMRPYVEFAVNYGYIVEVLEPDTPWAKKPKVLYNRCTHNVPYINIQRMLDNYQPNVTGEYLLRYFGYNYKSGMTPPVLRKLPQYYVQLPVGSGTSSNCKPKNMLNGGSEEFFADKPNIKQHPQNNKRQLQSLNNTPTNSQTKALKENNLDSSSPISLLPRHQVEENQQKNVFSIPLLLNTSVVDKQKNASLESTFKNNSVEKQTVEASLQNELEQNLTTEDLELNEQNEDQNTLEAFERVEIEWESGEKWEEKSKIEESEPQGATSYDAKPQRTNKLMKSKSTDNVLDGLRVVKDWSTLCMFLPPWSDENKNKNLPDVQHSKPIVEKKSSYTCMEIGDTNISYTKNPHKIISTVSRDINEFHLPITDNKIPDQWMLHKSTSTHDNLILAPTTRCKNEEQHFEMFVQLFKNTDKSVLRDIFDKCCGDVNWAVDIVLDDMASGNLNIMNSINTPIHDIDVPAFDCDCLSAYNLIPDRLEVALPDKQTSIQKETQSPINMKKVKKETVTSEASIVLKRQIEENIVIPDSHYSEHYLKVRKHRRGEVDIPENVDTEKSTNIEPGSSGSSQTSKVEEQSTAQLEYYLPSTSKMRNGVAETCYTDLCENLDGDIETVNVTIGKDLILKLNEVYGGRTVELLDIIKPTINIPMFLLNEINALWVESVAHQIEESSKQSELMLEQDEELARQLAFKEEELSLAGKAPEIPDFKEIMDMDFALSLYQKDVAEWRNNLPDDLAAKLSREKLYNLFPSISSDVLSELLLAHDNNFQSTVEVLLTSTGQSEILNSENGVNKFVMEKEMERQEKLLQEEKEALSEVEWPLLQKSDKVDMSVVHKYRDEADKHLKFRNLNYQKAQDYIRRGMTQVGSYFSDVAAFHKMKFEQANSWAAASLMQVHAANATDLFTLDLHFLRVGEAKEAVDLFLDSHIQKLRDLNISSSQYHSLFFITGRGLHSQGKPKLKPAVKKRLQERGLFCGERNPGLIATRVCAATALSHQIA